MARSAMASLWAVVAIACLCTFVGVATAESYSIRDISKRVGNGTVQLKLESGGYLNAVGTTVGYTTSATDTSTYWRVEQNIIGSLLDNSVYLYNIATGKYLTYILPIPFLVAEGVKVQSLPDVLYSRWWFYEIDVSGRYKIGSTFNLLYFVSFTGSNSQSKATVFTIAPVLPAPSPPPPSPPPPSPPPPSPPPPPIFSQATIEALEFPHVYLHTDGNTLAADGVGKLVDLQYSLDNSNRYELLLLPNEGEDVYAIRNLAFNLYVRLDPTVFPGQEPAAGSTFHPNGVGRSSAVPQIEDRTKFKLIENLATTASPTTSFSFKLLHPNPELPNIYLRFDGKNVAQGKSNGTVNGQTYISDFERFLIQYY